MSNAPGLTRGQAWALALVATSTMSISYVDRQTVSVLAPAICASLGISEFWYGTLVSAFALAYLVGAPLSGRLIDRVGARRGLLGAVLLWSAVAAAHAFVPAFAALFALRVLLGIAESPSFPGAAQTIHRAMPPEGRARAFGLLFTGSSLGAMVAPLVAVAVERRFGWRVACLVTAAVGLAWVPLWLGVAFGRRARAALDGPSPEPVVTVPVEPAAGYRGPALEARAPSRMSAAALLTHPAVLRAALPVIASAPVIMFGLSWGSKYLVREFGIPQSGVGRYLWLPPLVFDLAALAFGDAAARRARARARTGRRDEPDRPLVALAAVLASCAAAMPLVHTPWGAILLVSVSMGGGAGLYVLTTVDLLSRVPPDATAAAGGTGAAAQSLAQIVAAPLIGHAVAVLHGYTWIAVAVGLWTLPLSIGWIAWRPPPRVNG